MATTGMFLLGTNQQANASENQSERGPLVENSTEFHIPSTYREVDKAIEDAYQSHDLKTIIKVLCVTPWSVLPSWSSEMDKDAVSSMMHKLKGLIQPPHSDEDSAVLQALVAGFDSKAGRVQEAEQNYKESIASLTLLEKQRKIEFRADGGERNIYGHALQRCQIGLALVYCRQNKLKSAERLYSKLMSPFYAQSPLDLYRQSKEMYANFDECEGASIANLASKMACLYSRANKPFKAGQKFSDLWDFVQLRSPRFDQLALSCSVETVLSSNAVGQRHGFDCITGEFPDYREMLECYIDFSMRHPQFCTQAKKKLVKVKLEALNENISRNNMQKRNSDLAQSEHLLLNQLGTDPDKALAALKAQIARRRVNESNNPEFVHSLNLISYQLTQLGMYHDAESFIAEAIDLEKKTPAMADAVVGQSCNTLGLLYLKEDRLNEAEPFVLRALQLRALDRSDPYAVAKSQIVYGQLLVKQHNLKKAEEQLVAATSTLSDLKIHEANQEFLRKIVLQPTQRIEFSKFMVADRDIQANRRHSEIVALIELANVYIAEQKFEKAEQALLTALTRLHDSTPRVYSYETLEPRVYEKFGGLFTAQGKYKEAQENFDLAEKLAVEQKAQKPFYADMYCAIAELNRVSGQKQEARTYYLKAADLLQGLHGADSSRVKNLRQLANQ